MKKFIIFISIISINSLSASNSESQNINKQLIIDILEKQDVIVERAIRQSRTSRKSIVPREIREARPNRIVRMGRNSRNIRPERTSRLVYALKETKK